ncbi:MAG TPA: tripartite tricarboxylate transporter substrate binding protein, partial [Burkholderiales bacterium]|nr:tripartite tricarboxylate transporter substrate binding protein [Burkholderiales bacterium]
MRPGMRMKDYLRVHLRLTAFIGGSILLTGLSFHMGTVAAQSYPSKPIRFILSYPPGGATDTLGRIVAKSLSDAWGVNVIADNRPGASGNIGTALCAKSPPDGYTMCMVAPAQTIASRLSPNAGYDSLKDFSHVTLVATVPMLLLVHPSLPVKNLSELIALAKRRPGALNYASSGGGASPHLAMELLKQQAGVDIALITYKGAGAQMVDHLAGRVEVAFAPAVGVMPFVKDGRLRAIAVSTKDRFAVLPNVPTASESGLKGYDASSWQGIAMPAGVPREILNRVSSDLAKALQAPAMKSRILE